MPSISQLSTFRIPSTSAMMDMIVKYKWWFLGAAVLGAVFLGYLGYMAYTKRMSDEEAVAASNIVNNPTDNNDRKEYSQENVSSDIVMEVPPAITDISIPPPPQTKSSYAQEGVRVQRECEDSSSGCGSCVPSNCKLDNRRVANCARQQNQSSQRQIRRNVPPLKNGMRQGYGEDATLLTHVDINDQLDPYIHTRYTFDGESAFDKPRYFDLLCCEPNRLPSGIEILNREEGLTFGH